MTDYPFKPTYFDPTSSLKYEDICPAASAAAKEILDTLRGRGHVLKDNAGMILAPVMTYGEMQRIIDNAIKENNESTNQELRRP